MTYKQAHSSIYLWTPRPHSRLRDQILRRAFGQLGWPFTSRTRCAIRYIELTGCTVPDACETFGISAPAVYSAMQAQRTGRAPYR
jgi:hypothetical protein